jgi:coenzyme PQQ precursor peptide PqqA
VTQIVNNFETCSNDKMGCRSAMTVPPVFPCRGDSPFDLRADRGTDQDRRRIQATERKVPAMADHPTDTERGDRTEDRVAAWVTPDYQIVETSLEVTAYFGAES